MSEDQHTKRELGARAESSRQESMAGPLPSSAGRLDELLCSPRPGRNEVCFEPGTTCGPDLLLVWQTVANSVSHLNHLLAFSEGKRWGEREVNG